MTASYVQVQFILIGEEGETQIRTLSDPDKNFFKKGNLDTFLMTVDRYDLMTFLATSLAASKQTVHNLEYIATGNS